MEGDGLELFDQQAPLEEPLIAQEAFEEEPEIDEANTYWAALPAEKLIGELDKKESAYFDAIETRGLGNAWLGAYAAYYGLDPGSLGTWGTHTIGFDGEEGELLRFRINEFRSYLRQSMTMALGPRPSFQALATNTDYSTLARVETADAAINYLYWSRYGERKERRTVEKGDLFGIGWTWVTFDPDGGEEIEKPIDLPPEAGGGASPATEHKPAGEVIIKSKAPWDVFYEPYVEEFDDHEWRCVRNKRSRWSAAAKFKDSDPEKYEKILTQTCESEAGIELYFGLDRAAVTSEEVLEKHFYHARTKSLPGGRYLVYIGAIVTYDGPIPYRSIPLADYCPAEYIGTAFGYAECWDWIPVCQMLDQITSDYATNIAAFGRQIVTFEEGTDLSVEDLANGIRALALPAGVQPPVGVNLAAMPEGADFMFSYLERKLQSLSALNAVTRGDPGSNIKSGQMAALFHSIAQQANSAKEHALDAHRERVANLLWDVVQDFVEAPMLVEIVGADERPYLQQIDPKEHAGVRKIVMKTAPPMLRTQAGRTEIAQALMQVPGLVTTPAQVIEAYTSGQIKPLYKAARADLLRISWENEQLMKGPATQSVPDQMAPPGPTGTPATYEVVPDVPVIALEPHHLDIPEHMAMLASPAARGNSAVMRAILAHVHEHLREWKGMDPAHAMMLKIPPPPSPMMPVGAPPDVGGGQPPQGPPDTPEPTEQSLGVPLPKPAQSPMESPA